MKQYADKSENLLYKKYETLNDVLKNNFLKSVLYEKALKDALKESNIKLSIDTSKYTSEGEYNVPVDVTLPEGYELVEKVTVRVTLTPLAEKQTE